MPDTGMFYLYEVGCDRSGDGASPGPLVEFVRAECNSCQRIFHASEPPCLQNIAEGGAVLVCPACGQRQAVAIARFEEFVARFSSQ